MNDRRKPLNYWELQGLADQIREFVPAPFQGATLLGSQLYLSFYPGRLCVLAIDLSPGQPFMSLLPVLPKGKKVVKPLLLFLNSHFKGRVLSSIEFGPELGRVLRLQFTRDTDLDVIEIQLIPRAVNIIAALADGRQVSWKKAGILKPAQLGEPPAKFRDVEEINRQWNTEKSRPKKEDPDKKVKRTIAKIEQDIANKEADRSRDAAQWIQENWSLEVPEEFTEFVDRESSIPENLARLHERAKVIDGKVRSARDRLKEMLSAKGTKPSKEPRPSLLKQAQATGRTFVSRSGISAVYGKSAKDNLRILRASKSWNIWLHIRGLPGAHAIVSLNRGQKLPERDLFEIASWLIRETAPSQKSERCEVIVAECRHVRPVKGAPGLVNVQNERVIALVADKI